MENWKGRCCAIDFDGVIHSYTRGYTGDIPEDPPTPGILEFIKELCRLGVNVVIFTCRGDTPDRKRAVREWLISHDFPMAIPITNIKPGNASWFIDDRGIRFNGDVSVLMEQMQQEPWHKG